MRKLLLICLSMLSLASYQAKAQTILVAGDIAFASYDSTPLSGLGDKFSFVLLTNIQAGTKISFTDRGYFGNNAWQAAGNSEPSITWTSGTALGLGTEVFINALEAKTYDGTNPNGVANGVVSLTEGTTSNGLSLSNVGDQIIAFQGGNGSPTGNGAYMIAGINYFYSSSTTDANWNVGSPNGPNSSLMPPGLTAGFSALYTGPLSGTQSAVAGRFNCTATPTVKTAANIRAALMDKNNWLLYGTALTDNNGCDLAAPSNTAPTLANLNGDSAVWPGVGNTVTLDVAVNATASDAEMNALNGGNGNYAGASLIVQRAGTAISNDVFNFSTTGALFTVSGSNLQSGGLTFATYTYSGGTTTINFTSSGTAATSALVNDVLRHISYRNDTPAGDATIRFSFSDGTATANADVSVTSDAIYITNATDAITIDLSNGVSLSEAIAIAAADATGSQTLYLASSLNSQNITLASNLSINESLTLNATATPNLNIYGSTLTLGGGTTLTFQNGSSNYNAIGSTFAGSGNLAISGPGILELNSTSNRASWSGGFTITDARVRIREANNISSGLLTLNTGTLDISISGTNVTATFANNVSLGTGGGSFLVGDPSLNNIANFSGVISGSGNLTKSAGSVLRLSGVNTYTGNTVINEGTLSISAANQLSSGSLTIDGGTLATSGSFTLSNPISLGNGGATVNPGAGTLTLNGVISGNGTLTKNNSGSLYLYSNNTFSGGLTVANGLVAAFDNATALGTGSITLSDATQLALANLGTATINNNIVLAGNATLITGNGSQTNVTLSGIISETGGARNLTINANSANNSLVVTGNNTYTGSTTTSGNLVAIRNQGSISSGTLYIGSSTFQINAPNVTLANNIVINTATNITTNNLVTFSGVVSGTGNITKNGAGTLTLSGANTNTGTLTVASNKITLNGSANNNITVNSGALLDGNGIINGNLTLLNGATLAPGNNVGVLTINGNLKANSGSTLSFDIGGTNAGTNYDQLAVNGTADIAGANLVANHSYTAGNADSYTLISNDGSDAITGTFSGRAEGSTLTANGNATPLKVSYSGGTGNDFTLTAPTASTIVGVTSSTANGTYKIGDNISIQVNFDQAVTVNATGGTPTLLLETGATDRQASYASGSGSSSLSFSYVVQAGDNTNDLDYTSTTALALNGGAIQNATLTLPSPGTSGSLGASKTLKVDGVSPTATIVLSNTTLRIGQTATVTFTFSEAVVGFTTADVTVPNGTLSNLSSADGGITWTATLTPATNTTDATNVITLDNTGVTDVAGNMGTGTTISDNYAVYTERPSVAISSSASNPTGNNTIPLQFTFSEAVTGFTLTDVSATNGTVSNLTTLDNISYTATLVPTTSGTVTVNVAANGATNIAGNGNTAATAFTISYNPSLPVTLTGFNAKLIDNSKVQVTWATVAELNNDRFELSRSSDGVNFTLIKTIVGQGTSNQRKDYAFTDLAPAQGDNYYQLTQFDLNGKSTDMGVKVVNVSLQANNQVILYPNPATSVAHISLQPNIYHTATLLNLNGQVLQHKTIGQGANQIEFKVADLVPATYLIRLAGKQAQTTKTFVKLD